MALKLRAEKKTYAHIAQILGRHPAAIFDRVNYGYQYARKKTPSGGVSRHCLRCRRKFDARGKFNRLCDSCANYARENHSSLDI